MLLHFTVDGQKRKGLETLTHPSMCNFWLGVISLTRPVVGHTQIMWPHFCNIPGMLHQSLCICDPWLSVAVLKWIRFMLRACSVHPNGHVMCALTHVSMDREQSCNSCAEFKLSCLKAHSWAFKEEIFSEFSDSALNSNQRNVVQVVFLSITANARLPFTLGAADEFKKLYTSHTKKVKNMP